MVQTGKEEVILKQYPRVKRTFHSRFIDHSHPSPLIIALVTFTLQRIVVLNSLILHVHLIDVLSSLSVTSASGITFIVHKDRETTLWVGSEVRNGDDIIQRLVLIPQIRKGQTFSHHYLPFLSREHCLE